MMIPLSRRFLVKYVDLFAMWVFGIVIILIMPILVPCAILSGMFARYVGMVLDGQRKIWQTMISQTEKVFK